MKQSVKFFTIATLASTMTACGGGGSGSGSAGETGSLSVGLTDAPVDSAQEVNIEVTALVLQSAGGGRSRFELEFPQPVNLLDLQSGEFENLIIDEEVQAGQYNWMRLELGSNNTVVIDETGDGSAGRNIYPLTMPSARGLQTSKFTVPAGGEVSLTIDFDVRKSLVNPGGKGSYKLKPVLRLVDNAEVGKIRGQVFSDLINQECGDAFISGEFAGNVYVHADTRLTPDDIGSANEPLTVAPVSANGEGTYVAAFVPAGDYRVSYSCGNDLVEDDQGEPSDDDISFVDVQTVTVRAGEITPADFDIQAPQ